MGMTASEYKSFYHNLKVNLGDGQSTNVSLNKYRLGQPKDGGTARQRLMEKVGKEVKEFELRVGPGDTLQPVDLAFTKTSAFRTILASPYTGKGAPEHCQAVLQLVHHFQLATDLQKYADDHLGLDCNGFVGNYVMHGWKGKPWTDHGREESNKSDGPDMGIDGFFDIRRHNRVKQWSEINTSLLYLLLRTKETGEIIVDRTGPNIGHIVMSDAGMGPISASDGIHAGLHVLESSGSHTPPGLYGNSYTWLAEKKAGTSKAIFKLDRGADFSANRQIWFLIVNVAPPPTT